MYFCVVFFFYAATSVFNSVHMTRLQWRIQVAECAT